MVFYTVTISFSRGTCSESCICPWSLTVYPVFLCQSLLGYSVLGNKLFLAVYKGGVSTLLLKIRLLDLGYEWQTFRASDTVSMESTRDENENCTLHRLCLWPLILNLFLIAECIILEFKVYLSSSCLWQYRKHSFKLRDWMVITQMLNGRCSWLVSFLV